MSGNIRLDLVWKVEMVSGQVEDEYESANKSQAIYLVLNLVETEAVHCPFLFTHCPPISLEACDWRRFLDVGKSD